MQQAIVDTSSKLKEDAKSAKKARPRIALALSSLARAWCDLEERKRVLRMRPAPKAVDAEEFKERRRARNRPPPGPRFTEPTPGDGMMTEKESLSDTDRPDTPEGGADPGPAPTSI